MPLVITFLIIAMLIGVAYELGMRYVLTYRLTGEDVRDVLFGVVPVSIRRYRFITEVHTTSFFDGQFRPGMACGEQAHGSGGHDLQQG